MTRTEFDAAIQKICAAFVFPYPEEETRKIWHQTAGSMDMRAAAWVVNAFISRTGRITRGTNLGHELAELYAEYRQEQQAEGFRRARENIAQADYGCANCSQTLPGFFRVHIHAHGSEPESRATLFRCACNTDPRFGKYPAWTRAQILAYPFMEILP